MVLLPLVYQADDYLMGLRQNYHLENTIKIFMMKRFEAATAKLVSPHFVITYKKKL
jgi:hypothetical protein